MAIFVISQKLTYNLEIAESREVHNSFNILICCELYPVQCCDR